MESIFLHEGLSISDKRINKNVWLSSVNASCKCTGYAGKKYAEKAETCSKCICNGSFLEKVLPLILPLHNVVQDIES